MKFGVPLDLAQLELQNARIQNLGSDPGSPVEGQIWINTTSHVLKYYNGTTNVSIGTGTGSVTSVGLSLPSEFNISNSPVTTSGTLTGAWADQTTNKVFAAPNGSTGTPTFRLLVAADIPTLTANKISDFDTQVRTNRLDQMANPTASVSMNSQKITNLQDGTAAADAATFGQLSSMVQGLNPKPGATVATNAALPAATYANGTSGVGATLTGDANGALTVDSYAVAANDIVLVKNQAAGLQNGLYVVTQPGTGGTPFILTRHTAMDTAAEFPRASIVVEDAGTAWANSYWVCTNSANPTVGTTAITFSQLNGATQLSGTSNRITISGNTIDISSSYVGQASITTLGTITTGTWNGTDIAVADGGTGSSTAAGARTNLGATGKYTALIGDGSSTAIAVTQATHGLASNGAMIAKVYNASTGDEVIIDININNSNGTVTFTFAVAPTSNAYRIVIIG